MTRPGLTESHHGLQSGLRLGVLQTLHKHLDGFFVTPPGHAAQSLVHMTKDADGGQAGGQEAGRVVSVLQQVVESKK